MAFATNFSTEDNEVAGIRCHNPCCTLKGKRVTVRRSIQCVHGFDLKSQRGSIRASEEAPKVFR